RRPVRHRAPRRIFFVIDRRLVVDETHRRALRLQERLHTAGNGSPRVLREAAAILEALGGSVPLHVSVMRGGMYRDESWLRWPTQPAVCVTTVDQLGSRLLFRGYGVGSGVCNTRPIHAGLTGNDSLIIL